MQSHLLWLLSVYMSKASALPSILDNSLVHRAPSTRLSMAAFGDSFSAGIGAGLFYPADQNKKDGANNNKCARMTGSYPVALKGDISRSLEKFDFLSCSGNVLDHIDEQVTKIGNDQYDVATVSISGNDFTFGEVVSKCVYPVWLKVGKEKATQDCNAALKNAQDLINDEKIWEKYRTKLSLIQDKALKQKGHIYITGYAKFFSAEGAVGDACDKSCFFNVNAAWRAVLCVLDMKHSTRVVMNNLVDQVNNRIQRDVVARYTPKKDDAVHFIDIDPQFNGHRFCEKDKPIWGATEQDVWFNEISSDLEEKGNWDGPALMDLQLTDADVKDLTGNGALAGRGVRDKFQQSSVFHPKKMAHALTSNKIAAQIVKNQLDPQEIVTSGQELCIGLSRGGGTSCFRVPTGCVVVKPLDNTIPTPYCDDGRDAQLESIPSRTPRAI